MFAGRNNEKWKMMSVGRVVGVASASVNYCLDTVTRTVGYASRGGRGRYSDSQDQPKSEAAGGSVLHLAGP